MAKPFDRWIGTVVQCAWWRRGETNSLGDARMAVPREVGQNCRSRSLMGRAAHDYGLRSEWLAALFLRLKGYRVLARRLRTTHGEIDLVCRSGHVLVFVEVKARGSAVAGLGALAPRQQRRIAAAAQRFLKDRSDLAGLDCRFDLITRGRHGLPRHVEDIWRPPHY